MGNPGTDLGEFFGVFQEVHNFLQFFLFLIRAGNIRKGDFLAVGYPQNGAGFAEVIQRIAVVGPAHHKAPGKQQHQPHNQQRQNQVIGGCRLFRTEVVIFQHAVIQLGFQRIFHFRAEPVCIGKGSRHRGLPGVGLVQIHGDHIAVHLKGLDLLIPEQLHHFGIGYLILTLGEQAAGPGKHRDEQHQIHNHRDNSTILQLGSPYFVYTSGFRMPT